jgi:hypothetical protein
MGLVAFLSVSKSFRLARDLPHRYRRTRQRLLPRFEPVSRAPGCADSMKTEMKSQPERAGRPGLPEAGSEAGPRRESRPERAPETPSAVRATKPWWSVLSWFSPRRWGLKRPGSTRRAAGSPFTAVQQELALDKVKPCRNDLSDADWELAPPPLGGAKRAFLKNLANSRTSGSRVTPEKAPGVAGTRV